MDKITADWKKLMEDASDSTAYQMKQAINTIDDIFGKGYSKSHPELVAAYINAATKEYSSNCIAKALYDVCEYLSKQKH